MLKKAPRPNGRGAPCPTTYPTCLRAAAVARDCTAAVNLQRAEHRQDFCILVHRIEIAHHSVDAAAHTLRIGQFLVELRSLETAEHAEFDRRPLERFGIDRQAPRALV